MNKQKVEKKAEQKEILHALKMKYFWQQKAEEIGKFFSVVIAITFIPYLFGKFLYFISPTSLKILWEDGNNMMLTYWAIGFDCLAIILITIVIIKFIIKLIRIWIKSNLKKAELRARKDLKNKMKGGKNKWNKKINLR